MVKEKERLENLKVTTVFTLPARGRAQPRTKKYSIMEFARIGVLEG